MTKLKIAYDAKRLFLNHTGLGNYSRTIVKNLVTNFPENEYHLFSPKIEQNEETDFFFDKKNVFIHYPRSGSSPWWRTITMSHEVNAIKPHIFHGLSHELPFGLNKDIKKLVSFHDLIWEVYPDQFPFWDRLGYKLKYRGSARRADHIISVSKSTESDLIRYYGIPQEKITVIYQACGDYFKTNSFAVDRNHLLYVGSIIPRKGLDKVIQALHEIPIEKRKALKVVGQGSGPFMEKCLNMIKALDMGPWVQILGKVPNHQLTALYDGAVALVFPSIYEGFGIPVIEAIHRACPVITSNVSSLPEAGVALTTLIDPNSVEEIRLAIEYTIDHSNLPPPPEILHKALAPFDGDFAAHKMMELYTKITATRYQTIKKNPQ